MKKLPGILITILLIIAALWVLRMLNDGTLTAAKLQAIFVLVIEAAKFVLVFLVDGVILLIWLAWNLAFFVTAGKITPPPSTPSFIPLF